MFARSTQNVLSFVAVVALAVVAACGSATPSGTGGGTACKTNNDCDSGQYCDAGTLLCTTKQCDDAAGKKCENGKKCQLFQCVALTQTDAGTTDSVSDSVSTDGSNPVADVPPGTDAPVAVDNGPPADTGPAPKDLSCGACSADADCKDAAYQCITLLSGKFCGKKCAGPADCAAGYKCDNASSDPKNTQKNCVLPSFDCGGCAAAGCGAGQKCNLKANPPVCADVKAVCDECVQDANCDAGLRCVKMGDKKICAPDCSAGQACPDKSSCQAFVVGKVCAFAAAACCYGASCTVDTKCAACPDKCVAGLCVECNKDADCKAGTCNVNTHTCIVDSACPADKPIKLASTKQCVECSNDTHCASKPNNKNKCNAVTNVCEAASANNECAPCAGTAFPGCVQLNGVWTCVECITDNDCDAKKAGTCSGTTYSCSGSIGPGTGPAKGSCKVDGDCANGPNTTFVLACDAPTGLCFDKEGHCDNVVAFCNAGKGSSCVDAAGLGLPPGLPGLPGGGGAGGALKACSCPLTPAGAGGGVSPACKALEAILPNLKNCDCAKDPKSPDCQAPLIGACCGGGGGAGGIGDLLGMLACLQPKPNPVEACFGGNCTDSGCLTSMMGGGQNKATGEGSCAKGGIGP